MEQNICELTAHEKTVKQNLMTFTVFNAERWYSYTGYIQNNLKENHIDGLNLFLGTWGWYKTDWKIVR